MPVIQVRPFGIDDVDGLLQLMVDLARFEGYIDQFRVTPQDLVNFGLGPNPRFEALVAVPERSNALAGMAVLYRIPWTYDLRPTIVLKELFVSEGYRSVGVGRALLEGVAWRAREVGAARVHWTVLKSNDAAQRFYRSIGGRADPIWDLWGLDEPALIALAGR